MLALIMGIVGLSLIPCIICAAIYHEKTCLIDCIICAVLYITIGFSSFRHIVLTDRIVRARDGYLIVASCWIFACLLGCIVFFFSDQTFTFAEACFESTAGFTTTGATLMYEVTASKSMLLFKAIAHWLGGMGILVFIVSIFPKLGIGGQSIAMAETPTPKIEKVTDRISDTTRILYILYIAFTLIEFCLLFASKKIDLFDAIVNTLSTISTGGFMTHDVGIAYYESIYVEAVIIVFSLLVSVNFSLYYFFFTKKPFELFKNTELRVFLTTIFVVAILISLNLTYYGTYSTFLEAFRSSITQVVSFATTSGFSFADYLKWPSFSKMLLFLLMLVGGCASSTAGGLKTIRAIVAFKLVTRGFVKRIHPRSVVSVKIGESSLDSKILSQIATFIVTFICILLIGTLVLSIECPSLATAMSTTVSLLSNTGLSIAETSALNSFNLYSQGLLIFQSLLMLIGRLELFTILMLFVPEFWNFSRHRGYN